MSQSPANVAPVTESDQNELSRTPILSLVDRIGFGYVLFDATGQPAAWNTAAMDILELQPESGSGRRDVAQAFRELISFAAGRVVPGALSWVVIPYPGAKPMILQESPDSAPEGTSIVVLIDRTAGPRPNPARLQQMFGLTGAETQLALRLAHGETPLEVAQNRRLSRTTIRSQLAALFAKTGTNRQAELVALLGRMAVLP